MKDKYKVKRTCSHCEHKFEFWNTDKFTEEIKKNKFVGLHN